MFCGGETMSTGGVSVNDQLLFTTCEAACGPTNQAAFDDILQGFQDFLSLPRNRMLAAAMAKMGKGPQYISNLFRRFLIEGNNCPGNSYETDIRIKMNTVIATEDPARRHFLWHDLVREYSAQTAPLLSDFEDLTDEVRQKLLLAAQRLEILAEKFKFIENAVRSDSNPDSNFNFNLIIAIESQHIQSLNDLISKIIETTIQDNPNIMEHENDVKAALREFKRAWDQFSNPFNFIESLTLLYAMNPASVGITIGNLGKYPALLKPEDPLALRSLISDIVLAASESGTQDKPVEIVFSWDGRTNELVITFKDTWIDFGKSWGRLKESLDDYGAWKLVHSSLASKTLYIPVKLTGKNPSRTNSGGENGGSSTPPFGGGLNSSDIINGIAAASREEETSISHVPRKPRKPDEVTAFVDFSRNSKDNPSLTDPPCLYDAIVIGSPQPIQTPPATPIMPYLTTNAAQAFQQSTLLLSAALLTG
jgi:hypothetical protein